MVDFTFFATVPKGMETLLADELVALGASQVKTVTAGASFNGPLSLAYRVCLWSRTASRVLLPLAVFPAPTPEALYQGILSIDWGSHLAPDGTLAVNFSSTRSTITHTQFGAQKVKDAVVDQFRDRTGRRPSVDLAQPDLRINVHLDREEAVVRLDLAGESLHRRGYRGESVAAPLKENLAAAILLRGGWPAVASAGGSLLDPMCGSATLPLEAALMAGDIAPGLLRTSFGFLRWPHHDARAWETLLAEARDRREAGLRRMPAIVGYDADPAAVRAAHANVRKAGLTAFIHIEKRHLSLAEPPRSKSGAPGLLVANPPYGERLGSEEELRPLYEELGRVLKERFTGWKAAVFSGNPGLVMRLGIRARRRYTLYNGAIECRLFTFLVEPDRFMHPSRGETQATAAAQARELGPGALMLANRLRKDLKSIGGWARREKIDCYRLYDADLPEYAAAVDLYREEEPEGLFAIVQEYEAPATIDPDKARLRLAEILETVTAVLDLPPDRVILKVRRRQRGRAQYEKMADEGRFHAVREGESTFLVNITDYLDTGLFLDHRLTRALIRSLAADRRFLNLFCYTGTATVAAASGGAAATVSVDLSNTYLEWARRNLAHNGFAGREHEFVRSDCLEWLRHERRKYGLIFLDPPTFSSSKRMENTLDVQRDHPALIKAAARLLEPEGLLLFSTNSRKFKLDHEALSEFSLEEITKKTIPRDFERNPRIHACWLIRPGG
jgi:23S rRNA (guanine2445-N2)-methyltransferase / 23S rRNA (guanine2069-N7)-methyltransferase